LRRSIEKLDISALADVTACLVHNDAYGANFFPSVPGERPVLIDWDNLCIDVQELDFVKLKHWTVRGSDGVLRRDERFFRFAVEGHDEVAERPVDHRVLRLYEVLWLLRVANFEAARERAGLIRPALFPPASVYALSLRRVLQEQ
jgi:hypothetical protein